MQLNEAPLPGQIGDADLRLLRVFKAVADCGGLAAAERELGIALSTISRHLKDLEQRLGLTLARRGRKRVEAAHLWFHRIDAFAAAASDAWSPASQG